MMRNSEDKRGEGPTTAVIASARKELADWQAPKQFVDRVKEFDALVSSGNLFNRNDVGFLTEALALAQFVQLRPPDEVRLSDQREEWPDGQIRSCNETINVEITEVLAPGRRRGQEYRSKAEVSAEDVVEDRPEQWRIRASKLRDALDSGIQKKVGKNYGSKPLLLVYVDIGGDFGLMHRENESAIAELIEKHRDKFHAICVIWKDKLYGGCECQT